MFNIGDDVFVCDTCSFASTITEIKDGKLGVIFDDFITWYDIDSWKVELYDTNKTYSNVMYARDYRKKEEIK